MPDAFAHCRALVHTADPDRSLAAMFAPKPRRDALIALYAFNAEVARIPAAVTEPLAGEIRLQWWREVLEGRRPEEARGHPVAAAIVDVVKAHALPLHPFEQMIEARRSELAARPFETLAELTTYAVDTSATLMELSALILARDCGVNDLVFAQPAGISVAMTGLLRVLAAPTNLHGAALPDAISPADLRAQADSAYARALPLIAAARPELTAAWLPVALVPLYLRALDRPAQEPPRGPDVSAFRKAWALWRAARNGRPAAP